LEQGFRILLQICPRISQGRHGAPIAEFLIEEDRLEFIGHADPWFSFSRRDNHGFIPRSLDDIVPGDLPPGRKGQAGEIRGRVDLLAQGADLDPKQFRLVEGGNDESGRQGKLPGVLPGRILRRQPPGRGVASAEAGIDTDPEAFDRIAADSQRSEHLHYLGGEGQVVLASFEKAHPLLLPGVGRRHPIPLHVTRRVVQIVFGQKRGVDLPLEALHLVLDPG